MNKIQMGCYVVGMIQTNFYYLHREGNAETIVFDPGDSGRELFDALTQKGLVIKGIFLTHGHYDHIYGLAALREACGAPVYASELEREVLLDPELNTSSGWRRNCTVKADYYLKDLEVVTVADITLQMISTPGHTEGSCCYYIDDGENGRILLSGDTLFQESVGRTDLPTGDSYDLTQSVRNRLFVLPDDTQVFPGHGGFTSIGHEKKYNYFV